MCSTTRWLERPGKASAGASPRDVAHDTSACIRRFKLLMACFERSRTHCATYPFHFAAAARASAAATLASTERCVSVHARRVVRRGIREKLYFSKY